MNGHDRDLCNMVDDYIDGELTSGDRKIFVSHLEQCTRCQLRLNDYVSLKQSLQAMFSKDLDHDADLRIRRRIRHNTGTGEAGDILDMEDLARLLKIPVSEVVDLLDELPSFEIGGRLRFRRSRIMEWISGREQNLMRDRQESSLPPSSNIIKFPGGLL